MAKASKKKVVKEKEIKETKEKKSTIFDLISFLTDKKKSWDELEEYEKKLFSPYMVNRFLSMELFFAQALNEIQKVCLGSMTKKDIWQLYYYLLPEQRVYLKYIKNSVEVPIEDIDALKKYFFVSKRECEDYWLILQKNPKGEEILNKIRSNYE